MKRVQTLARSTKRNKLQNLSNPIQDRTMVSGFSNLSNMCFSQQEISILNKGPTYVPPSRPISNSKFTELCADLEVLSSRLKSQVSHLTNEITEFKGGMERIMKEMRDKTVSERDGYILRVIKSIKAKDIIINQSDKSKRLIAMDNDEYTKMVSQTLDNHVPAKFIQPVSAQYKFNKTLASVASKYDEPTRRKILSLKTSEPLPSNLYCLPKDHKIGILKGRPIVAATDTPSTKLSRWLASIFKPLLKYIPTHVPSTSIFKDRLLDISRNSPHKLSNFASLDVRDLYGSIPIEDSGDTIGVITAAVNFYDTFKDECELKITRNDVGTLLKLCLSSDIIHFDGKAYKQLNGLAMGNNIAPILAIIYMHFVESEVLSRLSDKIIFFQRYLDDCFLIYRNLSTDDLLSTFNSVNKCIQFTIEEPHNSKLPFLDLMIFYSLSKNCFSSSIYFKDCHSGTILPWSSNVAISTKRNTVINEFSRAIRNSSDEEKKLLSMSLVQQRFCNNGYPRKFLYNCKRILDRKSLHAQDRMFDKNKLRLIIPFHNEKLKRKTHELLRRTGLSDHVQIVHKHNPLNHILRKPVKTCVFRNCEICKLSDKNDICSSKFCVYKITCNICSAFYIGETMRTFHSRVKEHLTQESSAVFQHLKSHNALDINNIKWNIIHKNIKCMENRRRVETMMINLQRPSLNATCVPASV